MQRELKATLMLLYAAQLGIAFQHSLAHLYEDATRGLRAYLTHEHSDAKLLIASQNASDQEIAAGLRSHGLASSHPVHDSSDVEEKQKHDRTRAARRRKFREIIYYNVWDDIRRIIAPENGVHISAVTRPNLMMGSI